MLSDLRKCKCGAAMHAMAAPGFGLADALFLCAGCDVPPVEEASWVVEYWRRKLGDRS